MMQKMTAAEYMDAAQLGLLVPDPADEFYPLLAESMIGSANWKVDKLAKRFEEENSMNLLKVSKMSKRKLAHWIAANPIATTPMLGVEPKTYSVGGFITPKCQSCHYYWQDWNKDLQSGRVYNAPCSWRSSGISECRSRQIDFNEEVYKKVQEILDFGGAFYKAPWIYRYDGERYTRHKDLKSFRKEVMLQYANCNDFKERDMGKDSPMKIITLPSGIKIKARVKNVSYCDCGLLLPVCGECNCFPQYEDIKFIQPQGLFFA